MYSVANPAALAALKDVVETVALCRAVGWDVLNSELVELLTDLEEKAAKALAAGHGHK